MSRLIIDIGNTRTKVGIFLFDRLIYQESIEKLSIVNLNLLLTNHSIENIIYSSVVQLENDVLDLLNKNNAIALSHTTPLPFDNQYGTPRTLGKDRLAAVAGATKIFPNKSCLVIDAGTCITYDWIIEGKTYIGGNISPGLNMRLKAMHQFTNALPLVPLEWDGNSIGTSTPSAMQNGGLWGTILEMQGIIDWSKSEWKQINVILTGGNTIFFANHLKRKIFAASDLVLVGLNEILNYNAQLHK